MIVCPLSHVPDVVARRAPSHLMTLLDPAHIVDTPQGLSGDRHLRCGVNDIGELNDGYICPDEALVQRMLAFAEDWDATEPMLVHCWAGISRSTATAYTLACERNPDGRRAADRQDAAARLAPRPSERAASWRWPTTCWGGAAAWSTRWRR